MGSLLAPGLLPPGKVSEFGSALRVLSDLCPDADATRVAPRLLFADEGCAGRETAYSSMSFAYLLAQLARQWLPTDNSPLLKTPLWVTGGLTPAGVVHPVDDVPFQSKVKLFLRWAKTETGARVFVVPRANWAAFVRTQEAPTELDAMTVTEFGQRLASLTLHVDRPLVVHLGSQTEELRHLLDVLFVRETGAWNSRRWSCLMKADYTCIQALAYRGVLAASLPIVAYSLHSATNRPIDSQHGNLAQLDAPFVVAAVLIFFVVPALLAILVVWLLAVTLSASRTESVRAILWREIRERVFLPTAILARGRKGQTAIPAIIMASIGLTAWFSGGWVSPLLFATAALGAASLGLVLNPRRVESTGLFSILLFAPLAIASASVAETHVLLLLELLGGIAYFAAGASAWGKVALMRVVFIPLLLVAAWREGSFHPPFGYPTQLLLSSPWQVTSCLLLAAFVASWLATSATRRAAAQVEGVRRVDGLRAGFPAR